MDKETRLLLVKAEHLLEMLHLCFGIDSGATESLDFDELCAVMSGARTSTDLVNPLALRDAIRALKVHVALVRADQIGLPILLSS